AGMPLSDVCSNVEPGPHDRSGPIRTRRSKRLRRAAEPWHETVRELEHLRRRAVVPLEPHDASLGEASRQREQPMRARTREAVDRLVVVADGAELVPPAEPEIEQRLLEEVHVLVLIDGEGAPALVHRRTRLPVTFEQTNRSFEQVFEVDQPLRRLS